MSDCDECLTGSDGEHDEGCSSLSVCGVSYDHDVPEGHTTCRRYDADCSEWFDDDPDD